MTPEMEDAVRKTTGLDDLKKNGFGSTRAAHFLPMSSKPGLSVVAAQSKSEAGRGYFFIQHPSLKAGEPLRVELMTLKPGADGRPGTVRFDGRVEKVGEQVMGKATIYGRLDPTQAYVGLRISQGNTPLAVVPFGGTGAQMDMERLKGANIEIQKFLYNINTSQPHQAPGAEIHPAVLRQIEGDTARNLGMSSRGAAHDTPRHNGPPLISPGRYPNEVGTINIFGWRP